MKQRIVLITGASSGIGQEIAKQLVMRGDFPLLVARNWTALQDFKDVYPNSAIFSCDITNQREVEQFIPQVIKQFGRVDVLINNAGYGRFGSFLDLSIEDYEGMMKTNYLGAVRLIHGILPYMLEQGGGRIINISSIAGLSGSPNLGAYSASKFALMGLSESLRLEYSPRIQVGVLCPGPVQTPFFGGNELSQYFPPLIARHKMDIQTVAKHAIKLIDQPRLKVIPFTLRLALKLRKFAPEVFFWITKKVYRSL